MLNGCFREMGLGGYPDVNLAEARDKAAEHRKKVKTSIDPIEARAEAQAKTKKTPTFTIFWCTATDGRITNMPINGCARSRPMPTQRSAPSR